VALDPDLRGHGDDHVGDVGLGVGDRVADHQRRQHRREAAVARDLGVEAARLDARAADAHVDRQHRAARIEIETQQAGARIIDKTGPLNNPADRDHCLQYMVAIGLIYGNLTAEHYEDHIASDPRIDQLRAVMHVKEQPSFTTDYLDPAKRSIANALQIFFHDDSATERVEVHYPIGHKQRRQEALPLLREKLRSNLATLKNPDTVLDLFDQPQSLNNLPISEFLDLFETQAPGKS